MSYKHCLAMAATLSIFLPACSGNRGNVYTLYRTSPLDQKSRIHVATFDAKEGDAYNSENCQTVAELFQGQMGVRVKFWCERGRFHP